jgi:hypothetical protein
LTRVWQIRPMGQLLAIGGIVIATLAMLGLIWALDRI